MKEIAICKNGKDSSERMSDNCYFESTSKALHEMHTHNVFHKTVYIIITTVVNRV